LAFEAPAHWELVLALAARVAKLSHGARAADALVGCDHVEAFAQRHARRPGPAEWRAACLAGLQLRELGVTDLNTLPDTQAILDRVRHWLAVALPVHPDDGGLPAVERAKLGDVLAELGDPRFDPKRLHLPADPDLGFVHIAADPDFRIGTRNADRRRVADVIGDDVPEDECNDARTPTPEFRIARYPVTVAQFRAFVEADDNDGFTPGDADALGDPATRPVRWVNWQEARAYAAWLQRRLQTSPAFDGHPIAALVRESGWQVALPGEREWENAARGGFDGAVFPWGDTPDAERSNHGDTGLSDTCAVGTFPANAYGLHDMIGNVWEWTRTAYGTRYPHPEPEADVESKGIVVRGGSWYDLRSFARCAIRDGNPPVSRNFDLGFRVVLCCSPVR
jgi:formylglycine-generating enzyme required for sulfatase activity